MKKNRILNGMIILFGMLFMFSCKSPQTLMEIGEYDEAVIKAVQKLRKQKKKKEKHIVVVEDAFLKVTNKDLRKVEALKAEGNAANWIQINDIHKKIQRRQEIIEPYLPLVAKNGYKANFKFVKIAAMELNSRKRAAAYVYDKAAEHMVRAEGGSKLAARNAFDLYSQIDGYFNDYKDADELRRKAEELGTNHVLMVVKNSSFGFYPAGFERELLRFNENRLEDFWTAYYTKRDQAPSIDYKVVVDIRDIDVSPELVNENAFTLSKDIKKKVEVAKEVPRMLNKRDSLQTGTQTVKEFKTVINTVFADVLEIRQAKSAYVGAELSIYDDKSQNRIFVERVNAESVFENVASSYRGDRRALTSAIRCNLNNTPQIFPSDEQLVLEAAGSLKTSIERCIRKKDNLVMN